MIEKIFDWVKRFNSPKPKRLTVQDLYPPKLPRCDWCHIESKGLMRIRIGGMMGNPPNKLICKSCFNALEEKLNALLKKMEK